MNLKRIAKTLVALVLCSISFGCGAVDQPTETAERGTVSSALGRSGKGIDLSDIAAFTAQPNQWTVVRYINATGKNAASYSGYTYQFTPWNGYLKYQVCASLASFTDAFELDIFVGGVRERALANSKYGAAQGCRTITTDKPVDVRVRQTTSASMAFNQNAIWNWMTVEVYEGSPPNAGVSLSMGNVETFTVPNADFNTKIPFKSPIYDVGWTPWKTADKQFVPKYKSKLQVCASLSSGLFNDNVVFELDIFVNNQRTKALAVSKNGVAAGCQMLVAYGNDVVDVRPYQTSGALMTFPTNSSYNWLTVDVLPISSYTQLGNTDWFDVPSGGDHFTMVPFANMQNNDGIFYRDGNSFWLLPGNAGNYQICASLYTGSATQVFEMDLFLNGVYMENREKAFAISSFGAASGCRTVGLADRDEFAIGVYQGSGSTMSVSPNSNWNWLQVNRVP
jgi:hypothetical protein